jgi:GNAT superfamily N-acetyltransferase
MLEIRQFNPDDRDPVVKLWESCGLLRPANDPIKDIARKLKERGDPVLVGIAEGETVATVMVGYEGHRGWLNYMAVMPSRRKKGYGRQMVREAERRLLAEGRRKVNHQVRATHVEAVKFYAAMGYSQDNVLSCGKRLEHDT